MGRPAALGRLTEAIIAHTGCGFEPCGPFGTYQASPYNTFMTIRVDDGAEPGAQEASESAD